MFGTAFYLSFVACAVIGAAIGAVAAASSRTHIAKSATANFIIAGAIGVGIGLLACASFWVIYFLWALSLWRG